jgi:hypothetical protein
MPPKPDNTGRVIINEGTLKKSINPPPTTQRPPAPRSQGPASAPQSNNSGQTPPAPPRR